MGKNAQRRRTVKAAVKAAQPTTLRPRRQTRALGHLREKMLEVQTRAQFEQMIRDAHADRQGPLRTLLEPMLRRDLPCCGQAMLAASQQQAITLGQHGLYCPTRNRVVLA